MSEFLKHITYMSALESADPKLNKCLDDIQSNLGLLVSAMRDYEMRLTQFESQVKFLNNDLAKLKLSLKED